MATLKINNELKQLICDTIYPVGAIYLTVGNENPKDKFGGTWEQIKDTFLLGAGNTYAGGSTGGEALHKLTINEMPEHTHELPAKVGGNSTYSGWTPDCGAIYVENKTGYSITTTGLNAAHNNMPPYLAVYIWKRTK